MEGQKPGNTAPALQAGCYTQSNPKSGRPPKARRNEVIGRPHRARSRFRGSIDGSVFQRRQPDEGRQRRDGFALLPQFPFPFMQHKGLTSRWSLVTAHHLTGLT